MAERQAAQSSYGANHFIGETIIEESGLKTIAYLSRFGIVVA